MAVNYKQVFARINASKQKWIKSFPFLQNCCYSGIYILTRTDESGFNYAYIGQAKNILDRLASHLTGYQHIDLSLKNHGLYDETKNPHGWNVRTLEYDLDELNSMEQEWIKVYASKGYQLRNKTAGSQSEGKTGLDNQRQSKSYSEGVKYGYLRAKNEFREYFNTYLSYDVKQFKKDGTPTEMAKKKKKLFEEFLNENSK